MPKKAARIPQIRRDRNYAVIYVDGEKIVLEDGTLPRILKIPTLQSS